MELFLAGIILSIFALLFGVSVTKRIRITGIFAGVLMLVFFSLLLTTGLQVPYGHTEQIAANQNVTYIYQNFTEVFHTMGTTEKGATVTFFLLFAVYVIVSNVLDLGRTGQRP